MYFRLLKADAVFVFVLCVAWERSVLNPFPDEPVGDRGPQLWAHLSAARVCVSRARGLARHRIFTGLPELEPYQLPVICDLRAYSGRSFYLSIAYLC